MRIHTRIEELGPTRIGDASGTNTVLFGAQPSANPCTSASKSVTINISVNSRCLTRKSLVEPSDEADGDGRDDAFKH
jgi:hypothetical protein